MRTALSVSLALLLAACAGGPAAPDWQVNSLASLKNFEAAYFAGNTRAADAEFARARADLASTGRAELVARAELVRCAAQVASLAFDDCPGFRALAADAGAAERAYAAYLAGAWQGLDAGALPVQHRAVVTGTGELPPDPFARLVAAGALLRAGRIAPAGIAAAVDAASANGWRRPLLAWLGVQEKRAADAGDADSAARIRRRIELVSGGGK
ncbi:MAG: hypothetical protein JSS40_17410 [Proteobacteria bacterium]|nr:hypothetical protein [Pseudomonadota bacterium]